MTYTDGRVHVSDFFEGKIMEVSESCVTVRTSCDSFLTIYLT